MHQMKREGGFVPSNSRADAMKVTYRLQDGSGVKLHVRRLPAADDTRLAGSNVFVLSASVVGADGRAESLSGRLMVGQDHSVNMQTGGGATLESMAARLFHDKAAVSDDVEAALYVREAEGTEVERRFGADWHPWLTLPTGATDAQILMADLLEVELRAEVMRMLDLAEAAAAIDGLVATGEQP